MKLSELEKARQSLLISSTYFSKSMNLLKNSDESGEFLLSQLSVMKNDLLREMNPELNITKGVINSISMDIQIFTSLYTEYRFISGPSVTEKPVKPNKRIIVVLTFFTSLFLMIILSFILEWWQNNKAVIQA